MTICEHPGVPTCVLEKAAAKSSEFESTYGKHKHVSNTKFSTSIKDDEITVIKDLLHATKSWNHHLEDSQVLNLSFLSEIQQRARLLVPGSWDPSIITRIQGIILDFAEVLKENKGLYSYIYLLYLMIEGRVTYYEQPRRNKTNIYGQIFVLINWQYLYRNNTLLFLLKSCI